MRDRKRERERESEKERDREDSDLRGNFEVGRNSGLLRPGLLR